MHKDDSNSLNYYSKFILQNSLQMKGKLQSFGTCKIKGFLHEEFQENLKMETVSQTTLAAWR